MQVVQDMLSSGVESQTLAQVKPFCMAQKLFRS